MHVNLSSCSSYWSWEVKSLIIIIELSIYPFNSVSFVSQFEGSIVRCIDICNCYVFLMNLFFYHYRMSILSPVTFFLLQCILSDINIAIPAYLWLLIECYLFKNLFSFNLFVCLNLKYISCRLHIVGSYFQSDIFYFWFGCLIHSHLTLLFI